MKTASYLRSWLYAHKAHPLRDTIIHSDNQSIRTRTCLTDHASIVVFVGERTVTASREGLT